MLRSYQVWGKAVEGRTGVRAVGYVGECLVVPKRRVLTQARQEGTGLSLVSSLMVTHTSEPRSD